jgi:hypothetical protein
MRCTCVDFLSSSNVWATAVLLLCRVVYNSPGDGFDHGEQILSDAIILMQIISLDATDTKA